MRPRMLSLKRQWKWRQPFDGPDDTLSFFLAGTSVSDAPPPYVPFTSEYVASGEPLYKLNGSVPPPRIGSMNSAVLAQLKRLPTYHDGLIGTLVYPEPFWALDCVGLR